MVEQDTIKLLRECDAGVKMGVKSIEDVMDHVRTPSLRQTLNACKHEHEKLGEEIYTELRSFEDDGKDPNPIAESMSWIKTETKLAMNDSEKTVASLMTDGCDMGTKSLNRYLNQYKAASERSKDLAKRLIQIEDDLRLDLRAYL